MPLEIVRSAPIGGDNPVPHATAQVRDQLQHKLAELIDLGLGVPSGPLDQVRVVVGDPSWVNDAGQPALCVVQGHIDY